MSCIMVKETEMRSCVTFPIGVAKAAMEREGCGFRTRSIVVVGVRPPVPVHHSQEAERGQNIPLLYLVWDPNTWNGAAHI